MLLYLTNDDMSARNELDQDGQPGFDDVFEIRNSLFNFIVGNDSMTCNIRGTRNLIAQNTQVWNGGLSSGQLILLDPQCWKGGVPPSLPRLEYHNIGNVIRDNTVNGLTISGSGAFVRHAGPVLSCGNQTGGSFISGNRFPTTAVATWYADGSVDCNPTTATGNIDKNGSRNGV